MSLNLSLLEKTHYGYYLVLDIRYGSVITTATGEEPYKHSSNISASKKISDKKGGGITG
jgi:hypothetical protein